MPKIGTKKPKCKACNDTGKNSKGGPCYPCSLKPKEVIVKKKVFTEGTKLF